MRRFGILVRQQIWQLFISPSTYIAAFLFSAFMALMYLLALVDAGRVASENSPIANFLSVFWVPVLFMVPLLTMRTLADERRAGTLEALMTTPITAFQIVSAKFIACYFFYLLLWASTLAYPLISRFYLPQIAADPRFFDIAQISTGYLFIAVGGAMYVAVGIFGKLAHAHDARCGNAVFLHAVPHHNRGRNCLEIPHARKRGMAFRNGRIFQDVQAFRRLHLVGFGYAPVLLLHKHGGGASGDNVAHNGV